MEGDTEIAVRLSDAVIAAGDALLARYSPDSRPSDRADIGARIHANDEISMAILQPRLAALRPAAQFLSELETGAPGAGEFWIVDPVEGAINHIHGMPDWCISATLVRDNRPVATALHLPVFGATYSAVRGAGAFQNGRRLRVSHKPRLDGAMVGTGQAMPGESAAVLRRLGLSLIEMLGAALTVRVSVPATLQLIQVAAGRMDGFWQFSGVLSGLAAGALLIEEAGGVVTDLGGNRWQAGSPHFLAAPPQLAGAMRGVLHPLLSA